MTQKEFKQMLAVEENVWITLKNLQRYKTQADAKLDEKLTTTTFKPSQITETEEKKFVSQVEKNRWNDTYTKSETYAKGEIDSKLTDVIAGLAFKGTYATKEDLPTEGCKDGWLAIVIEDPEAQGKNTLYIYETAAIEVLKGAKEVTGQGKWIKLNDLMIPGLATETTDGLMSKEDKKKLNGIDGVINSAKEEVTQKVTALEQKHTQDKTALEQKITADITASEEKTKTAYEAADKVIDDKVTAMDTAYKAADTTINGRIDGIDTAYKAADANLGQRIDGVDTAYKAADQKLTEQIKAVDAKLVAATDEQITALFA